MNNSIGLNETKLELLGKEFLITRGDAINIGDSLKSYIESTVVEHKEYLGSSIKNTEGWIDYEGTARVGPWVLGDHSDSLALIYRPPPTPEIGSIMFIAILINKDNEWRVKNIDIARITNSR